MDAAVKAAALHGAEGRILAVTASTSPGLPGLEQRGLDRAGLGKRAERVWLAVTGSGLPWPRSKVTVTVSPDLLPKHERAVDLAVAVAVLAAGATIEPYAAAGVMYYAGLGGDGSLQPVPGVLPAAVEAANAGCRALVVAAQNVPEGRLVPGLTVIGASWLAQVTRWLSGGSEPEVILPQPGEPAAGESTAEIWGNRAACLAAEVSAAGGHHLALTGPPGLGSLLAQRVRRLLPDLDEATALEVTALHSAAGTLDPTAPLVTRPPFCAPDYGASLADMVGGREAGVFRPGAASLAHRGVLFLDRAADFGPGVLEALRGPARSGTLFRPNGFSACLPARFTLVTATVPCYCPAPRPGLGSCGTCQVTRAKPKTRLPELLRDQVSLRVIMTPPSADQTGAPVEAADVAAARVTAARERAALRLAGMPWRVNTEVPAHFLRQLYAPKPGGGEHIARAGALGLVTDAGAADVLRVAWTIADLNGHPRPTRGDCAAALSLRMGDAR